MLSSHGTAYKPSKETLSPIGEDTMMPLGKLPRGFTELAKNGERICGSKRTAWRKSTDLLVMRSLGKRRHAVIPSSVLILSRHTFPFVKGMRSAHSIVTKKPFTLSHRMLMAPSVREKFERSSHFTKQQQRLMKRLHASKRIRKILSSVPTFLK